MTRLLCHTGNVQLSVWNITFFKSPFFLFQIKNAQKYFKVIISVINAALSYDLTSFIMYEWLTIAIETT